MKFSRLFYTSIQNIHYAAFWLASFSICAAMLGLIRDRLLAAHFGASRSLDIYYAAFRVPDIIYTILLLFAGATAVIPIFLEKKKEGNTYAEELMGSLVLWFGTGLLILSLPAFFFMPKAVHILFPGFSGEDREITVVLSRILLLSPLLLGLSNIFSSITQSHKKFIAYALSPVLYNFGVIVGIILLLPMFGLFGLAGGVIIGALLHASIQLPSLRQIGFRFSWNRGFFENNIYHVLRLSVPRTLGLMTTQFMTTIITGAASTLTLGSIAIFNFATNLQTIPVTLIGLSYSVAAFPMLAELELDNATERFKKYFSTTFRHILFWVMPFSVLLLVLRAQIVRVVLGAGRFDWENTRLTAAVLFLLTLAVIFQSLFMLLVRAFYVKNETMRPVIINILSTVLGVGTIFWFIKVLAYPHIITQILRWILRISDISDIRVLALPIAVFVGSFTNFIFLVVAFRLIFGWIPWSGSGTAILKIIGASVVGGLAAYGSLSVFATIFNLHTFFGIFSQGLCAGIAGIAVYVSTLWVLQSEELGEIKSGIYGFIWKDHVPSPEPETLPH